MGLNYYGERIRVRELVFCPAVAIYNRLCFRPVQINYFMQQGMNFENYLRERIYRYEDGWLQNILVIYNGLIEGHPDFFNPSTQQIIEAKHRESLEVKSYDKAQAGLYAELLHLPKFTIVVGFLKNSEYKTKEYEFEVNHDIFPKMLAHAERLKKQIKEGRIWDEQWDYCPRYAFECRSCPYLDICEK